MTLKLKSNVYAINWHLRCDWALCNPVQKYAIALQHPPFFGNDLRCDPYCWVQIFRSWIRVITKLPNTEQSSKGKGKTHKSRNTKSVNNRKTGKTAMALILYRHFQRNGGLNKSARRGAEFIPIGMPTTCWNRAPPKETNMLSMRNFSILIICSS